GSATAIRNGERLSHAAWIRSRGLGAMGGDCSRTVTIGIGAERTRRRQLRRPAGRELLGRLHAGRERSVRGGIALAGRGDPAVPHSWRRLVSACLVPPKSRPGGGSGTLLYRLFTFATRRNLGILRSGSAPPEQKGVVVGG